MSVNTPADNKKQKSGFKHWEIIALYLIIYDIITINLSYFLGLWIRFDLHFSSIPGNYFYSFLKFAPVYTVIVLVVYFMFGLYNSLWRFASFSELNRVLVAWAISTAIQIIGITLFVRRMPTDGTIVLIHDGVRPLISAKTISDNIESVKKYGNGITCAPTKETVVLVDDDNCIDSVVERRQSRTAKAPESFYLKDILAADEESISKGITDEIDSCTLMGHHGMKMHVVDGDYGNIKITTPEDFFTFRALYDAKENEQLM